MSLAESAPAATPLRIIGIDPGSQCTGVGVIEVDATGAIRHVFHAAIKLLDNENFSLRLKQIFDEVSALKLGQARGAAICAIVNRGLAVSEYAAREVKQATVGSGAADKKQVQHMIGILLDVPGKLQADAADALAIALAHAHTRASTARLGIPRTAWRRRR